MTPMTVTIITEMVVPTHSLMSLGIIGRHLNSKDLTTVKDQTTSSFLLIKPKHLSASKLKSTRPSYRTMSPKT